MDKHGWDIRPARDEDWDGIWGIFREVISHGDTYTYAPDMTEEHAKDIWVRGGCHGYVVTFDNQIVGTFTIRSNKPGFGNHIANAGFMVHRDFRTRGIARAMCGFALREAKRLGFIAMQFNFVVASNKAAVELWKKMGFSIIGTVPNAFRHKTLGLTDVHIMYRSLEDVEL